jgi:hypothetical protein
MVTGRSSRVTRTPFTRAWNRAGQGRPGTAGAGPKRRHGRGLHFDCLAGARITRHPRCTTALFENAETGNGDAVTLMHCTHDRVDNVFDRISCHPAVRAELRREYVDQLCFVHAKPPQQ